MTSLHLSSLITALTILTVAPGSASADQFVLFDVTFPFTKEDADNSKPSKSHYYLKSDKLNSARPADWTRPVDYRNGTIHVRTEILEKPAGGEPTTWDICYIPNHGQGNGYGAANAGLYREKGVYEKDVPMTKFWQNDAILWAEGIKEIHLVMKDGSGGKGHAHKRTDWEKFFPTKMRITVVQVSAGKKYDPRLVPNLTPESGVEEEKKNATDTSAAPALDQAKPRQIAQLTTIGINGSDPRVIHEGSGFEAPNWSPDGKWLVFNNGGALWRIAANGSTQPEKIPTDVIDINNDHVLSPDGKTIYFSANGHLYAVPFEGGRTRRISNAHPPETAFKYYLHGVSPDNKTLAYVGVKAVGTNEWGRLDLYTMPATGGPDTRLTDTPAPDDGPEYSPDGQWIYFNSELDAKVPGHAQCYRMKPDGTGIQQLTHDERVNWFPHLSPDGKWIVYLSFPPGTKGHPANKDVILRRMRPDGSEQANILAFRGGQGTINVNSWSPDNKRFAFVAYPVQPDGGFKVKSPTGNR